MHKVDDSENIGEEGVQKMKFRSLSNWANDYKADSIINFSRDNREIMQ